MLNESDAVATIAVRDLDKARRFYEDILGFSSVGRNEPGTVTYGSGSSKLLVYQSEYAGTNQATSATWIVPDAEPIVTALGRKGVRFEHYDMPGLTLQGDLHVTGTFKGAWLKDPDGNILHIVSS